MLSLSWMKQDSTVATFALKLIIGGHFVGGHFVALVVSISFQASGECGLLLSYLVLCILDLCCNHTLVEGAQLELAVHRSWDAGNVGFAVYLVNIIHPAELDP